MPRKATSNVTKRVIIRLTPEQVARIDDLVEHGAAVSRTDFVKDAIMVKLYLDETRMAKITLTHQ